MPSYVKAIVFGDPGVGKTTFVASGVLLKDLRLTPGLFLNFEAGEISIASKVRDVKIEDLITWAAVDAEELSALPDTEPFYPHSDGKMDCLRVKSYGMLEDVLELLRSGRLPYKYLAVDSLSEINYLNLTAVVKYNKKITGKGDGELPQLQDYNRSQVQMRKIIRAFRDLDMHVFFVALAQEVKDDMTGAIQIRPSFVGKLSVELPAMVNIVGYIKVYPDDPNLREIVFQPRDRIQVKARTEGPNVLGKSIVYKWDDPILPMIFDKLSVE